MKFSEKKAFTAKQRLIDELFNLQGPQNFTESLQPLKEIELVNLKSKIKEYFMKTNLRNISYKLIIKKAAVAFLFFISINELHGKEDIQDLIIPVPILRPFKYKDFTNIWIADESGNPTGTHKDRFAQAVLKLYANKTNLKENKKIPSASIISAGSSAIAIQACLRKHNLPNLKVLVDHHISDSTLNDMEHLGCEVYKADLGLSLLNPEDILRLTNNIEGFDITFESNHDVLSDCYLDLATAIINQHPDYIFIPYGSGLLYHNFSTVAEKSHLATPIHLLGATVTCPQSRARKLYSPYKSWPAFIQSANNQSYLSSGIYEVTEDQIALAEEILKKNGYKAESSAAAGLALLIKFESSLPRDKKLVIISTGLAKTS